MLLENFHKSQTSFHPNLQMVYLEMLQNMLQAIK